MKKVQLASTPSMRRSKLDAYFLLENFDGGCVLVPAKTTTREDCLGANPCLRVALSFLFRATSQDVLASRLRPPRSAKQIIVRFYYLDLILCDDHMFRRTDGFCSCVKCVFGCVCDKVAYA